MTSRCAPAPAVAGSSAVPATVRRRPRVRTSAAAARLRPLEIVAAAPGLSGALRGRGGGEWR